MPGAVEKFDRMEVDKIFTILNPVLEHIAGESTDETESV
jgi:hypothetical protein